VAFRQLSERPNKERTVMLHSLKTGCVMVAFGVALSITASPAAVAAEAAAPAGAAEIVEFSGNVQVPMRDGVLLAADVSLPKGKGPFPTILCRTPYTTALGELSDNGHRAGREFGRKFVALGFAFVLQDCRGTGRSQGCWDPYARERDDGVDLQKWVRTQPWCNGKVATFGGSYCGFTQLAAASEAGDRLAAMCCDAPTFSWHDVNYVGGALRLETNAVWNTLMCRPHLGDESLAEVNLTSLPWSIKLKRGQWSNVFRHLPLRTWDQEHGVRIPWVNDTLTRPEPDEYWASRGSTDRLHQISAPQLICTGWYDLFLNQAFCYVPMLGKQGASETSQRHQHLIIGPWGHAPNVPVGDLDFGREAKIDLDGVHKQWYGRWLNGEDTGVDKWPFLRIFVMGANRWRNEDQWPLARTQFTSYFFHSDSSAKTLNGNGSLTKVKPLAENADRYIYDPEDPVPSCGGEWGFLRPCGPVDQRHVESRDDVLVYTSEELVEPLEVTGPVKVVLYAASDATDTDWTAKLVDVHPDGRAFNLCDGIIRARYRESFAKAKLLEPTKVYRYEIDLWATSNEFLPGHRIRVEVSSSNFPRFDRNPNTGHAFGVDAELRKANQTVYHDQEHPSHIVLPVIPRK
jgi:putative CocE/NonD family hydrolase